MAKEPKPEWHKFAACQYADPEALYAESWAAANHVKRILCDHCPVKRKCLADALERKEQWGIWGGMTIEERRRLFEIYPGVENWKILLGV